MKKLSEKELSKITGGYIGLGFDPTVSFMQKKKSKSTLQHFLDIFRKYRHKK